MIKELIELCIKSAGDIIQSILAIAAIVVVISLISEYILNRLTGYDCSLISFICKALTIKYIRFKSRRLSNKSYIEKCLDVFTDNSKLVFKEYELDQSNRVVFTFNYYEDPMYDDTSIDDIVKDSITNIMGIISPRYDFETYIFEVRMFNDVKLYKNFNYWVDTEDIKNIRFNPLVKSKNSEKFKEQLNSLDMFIS